MRFRNVEDIEAYFNATDVDYDSGDVALQDDFLKRTNLNLI